MPSKGECLLLCRSFSRGEVTCQWFSYDLRQKICFLLYSCPELNENLVDYLSGQVNCQNTPGKYHNFKFKLPFCYSKIEEKKTRKLQTNKSVHFVRMSCKILELFSVEHFQYPNMAGWNLQNITILYIIFHAKLLQTCKYVLYCTFQPTIFH